LDLKIVRMDSLTKKVVQEKKLGDLNLLKVAPYLSVVDRAKVALHHIGRSGSLNS